MGVSQNLSISLVGQDVSNNTTTVNIALTSTQTGESWSGYTKTGYYWISVNGGAETQYSFTTTLPKQSTITCFSVNHTFTHNSDGTGSISVRTSLATGISAGTVTTSSSYSPPTIPRATTPTLSASSAEMGSAITINTPRLSSGFTHTLTYTFGGASGTIATNVTTSAAWTIPVSLANQIPNSTSGVGTITCTTYNGSTAIGSKSVNFTAVVPSSVVPSISSIAISDPTGYASTYGGYVRYKSRLKVVVGASGSYSSSITKVTITSNGATVSSNIYESNAITDSGGSKTVSVTVTDSRGRSASATASYSVLDYASPTITGFAAYRSLQDGTQNENGEYMNVIYAGSITPLNNINGKLFKVEYKESSASSWTTAVNDTSAYSVSSNIVLDANTEKSYDVRFTVSDNFGYSAYASRISTAFVLLDFNKSGKAMAIGKVSEIDNTFEVGLPISSKSISADGSISAGEKVSMWTDREGGNIKITSPNGVRYEIDAPDDNLRIFRFDSSNNLHTFTIKRDGNVVTDGEVISTYGIPFRSVVGNYGFMIHNNGTNVYFLLTNSGDQYGGARALYPMYINCVTGYVYMHQPTFLNAIYPLNNGASFFGDVNNYFAQMCAGSFYIGGSTARIGTSSSVGVLYCNNGWTCRRYDNINTGVAISASAFNNVSSKRVKENVKDISEDEANKILDVDVKSFDYIEEIGGKKNQYGVIAEDVIDIIPSVVDIPDGYDENKTLKELNYMVPNVDYTKFIPFLIKKIQMQQKQIDELERKVDELTQKITC